MIRTLCIAVLAAASILVARPAEAQSSPADTANAIADAMQSLVGQTFDGGMTITSVSANGPTLIVVLTGPTGWRTGMSSEAITRAFVGGFCEEAPHLFDAGIAMRVDSVDNGVVQQGQPSSTCP